MNKAFQAKENGMCKGAEASSCLQRYKEFCFVRIWDERGG